VRPAAQSSAGGEDVAADSLGLVDASGAGVVDGGRAEALSDALAAAVPPADVPHAARTTIPAIPAITHAPDQHRISDLPARRSHR